MSIPKLLVLGLLSGADKHGYEMEEEIARSRMRMWAKIGMSSIYKALSDLESSGLVKSRPGRGRRGPGKHIFSIQKQGRVELRRLIEGALASRKPVYSERVAGLVYALRIGGEPQREQVRQCCNNIREGLQDLEAERGQHGHRLAHIVIDLYHDLMTAELRAATRVLRAFKKTEATRLESS